MALKIVGPKVAERDDTGPELQREYHGYEGQARFSATTYVASECDGVCALAISQARMRLARGDEPGAVQEWLTEQITQAAEDEAERARFGRRCGLTMSENPRQTRAACAASLARAVIHEWHTDRRR